jgi:hypothetical protein
MKQIILAISLLIATQIQAFAQGDYTVSTDRKTGFVVYNGRITPDDLKKEPSFTWYQKGIDKYKPAEDAMEFLQSNLPQYDIVVFMGTWCDDSHTIIPKLMRVLRDLDYKGKLTIYGVPRDKTSRGGETQQFNISRVPAIILMKDGKEKGRITENVLMTVEDDMEKIIRS